MIKIGDPVNLKFLGVEGIITAIATDEVLNWDYKITYRSQFGKIVEGKFHEFELEK